MSLETLKESILSTDTPKHLQTFSASARKALSSLELPHRRIENWKYTNLRNVFDKDLNLANEKDTKTANTGEESFHSINLVNGDITFCDDALSEHIEIQTEFNSSDFEFESYYSEDFASILNRSSASQAHKITLKANSIIEKPIHIHHSFTQSQSYNNYNSFIEVEKNVEVSIIEEFSSRNEQLINHKSLFRLAENSKCYHTVLQNTDTSSNIFLQFSAQVTKDAYYSNNVINIGARLSRTNFYGELIGEGAELDAHGLYLLEDGQHHDTMSYIKHISPRSYSHQLYKGVLDGKSRGVFSGIIRIEQDAQEVASDQLNKNLLLSDKAHANSRPQLEIYADDVKCAHGSTTGQLSDDELFYFESRGIEHKRAQSILAKAFVFDVILKIKDLDVRKYIEKILIEKHKVME